MEINGYTCQRCGRVANVRADHADDCPIRNPHPALLMPEPKGYKCPACRHDIFVHREAGCDVGDCDCCAPHGRIMPGDPEPSVGQR